MKKKILCLVATAFELKMLIPDNWKGRSCGSGLMSYDFDESTKVFFAVTGIGMVNAAIITERLIPLFDRLDVVLNFGIAGISDPLECPIGDYTITSEEWFGDLGIQASDGFFPLEEIGFPLTENQEHPWNRISVSERLSSLIADRTRKKRIPSITVNSVTASEKRLMDLKKLTTLFSENMEGAAIAYTCMQHRILFAEIRAISNIVGDRDKKNWRIKPALESLAQGLPVILKTVSEYDS